MAVPQEIVCSQPKKPRSSNLELYRIISMLLIIAHHFVVNSGLRAVGGSMASNPLALNSVYLTVFGAFGKAGINCFLMITGYFMCKSRISVKKFFKLMLEIYFYRIILSIIFILCGRQQLNLVSIVKILTPIRGFNTDFVACFIGFWLTIPFLNILVRNMNKKQHQWLLVLMLGMYSILGNVPKFNIAMNYVTWFGVIYFIASYIRLYPSPLFDKKRLWGWSTAGVALLMILSVVACLWVPDKLGYNVSMPFFFVSDSNKILAVLFAVTSFLWFKNLNIPQSRIINAVGASTFGVLLIHANSATMRQFLWKDTIDCVGHYSLPFGKLVLFSIGSVLAVFCICAVIDHLRILFVERPFFKAHDKHFDRWEQKLFGSLLQQ